MKKYIFSFFALLILTAVQCKKPAQQDQLPPITTTGANTFGCLINGNVWLPYTEHNIPALWVQGPTTGTYKSNAFISISVANTRQNENSRLYITIHNLMDTGTYRIYNALNEGLVYVDNNSYQYEPFDTFGIVKVIRLDTIHQIVSGTFSFIGTNPQFNKTVTITNGRFDVQWPYKQ